MNTQEIEVLRKKWSIASQRCNPIYVTQPGDSVRALFLKGCLKLVETKTRDNGWRCSRAQADLNDSESLCTYTGCTEIKLDGAERVVLTVWAGDSFSGHRTHVRCEFTLEGKWWLLKSLVQAVEHKWELFTCALVDKEELARLEARRKEVAEQILADTYNLNPTEGE